MAITLKVRGSKKHETKASVVTINKGRIWNRRPSNETYGRWYIERASLRRKLSLSHDSEVKTYRVGGDDSCGWLCSGLVSVSRGERRIGCCIFSKNQFAQILKWAGVK